MFLSSKYRLQHFEKFKDSKLSIIFLLSLHCWNCFFRAGCMCYNQPVPHLGAVRRVVSTKNRFELKSHIFYQKQIWTKVIYFLSKTYSPPKPQSSPKTSEEKTDILKELFKFKSKFYKENKYFQNFQLELL